MGLIQNNYPFFIYNSKEYTSIGYVFFVDMIKIKAWITAFRLRTLPLSLSCVFMGGALSNTFYPIKLQIFLLIITTTVLLQILSNIANDYGDGIKGTDDYRIGPDRMIQKGMISTKEMFAALCIIGLLTFIVGLLLIYKVFGFEYINISLIFLLIGIFAIWAAIRYTMGKKSIWIQRNGRSFLFLSFLVLLGLLEASIF